MHLPYPPLNKAQQYLTTVSYIKKTKIPLYPVLLQSLLLGIKFAELKIKS